MPYDPNYSPGGPPRPEPPPPPERTLWALVKDDRCLEARERLFDHGADLVILLNGQLRATQFFPATPEGSAPLERVAAQKRAECLALGWVDAKG